MRITNVQIMEVTAKPKDFDFEKIKSIHGLLSPAYIYPEYKEKVVRAQGNLFFSTRQQQMAAGEIGGTFVLIETDGGITGICPGGRGAPGYIIAHNLRPILVSENPLRVEKLWDIMYRSQVVGEKGAGLMALSTVDMALWDLIAKARGETVCSCLGGPTREEIPAYASALGYSVNPKDAARQALAFVEEGYTAMKWFFKRGPADGVPGMKENLELVKAIRDAVGYDVDIMLDAWGGWNREYALKMLTRLRRYEPRWVEEPTLTHDFETLSFLRKTTGMRISEGEREFSIWDFKQLIEEEAADVLSPSLPYCGGFSQFRKIAVLAEVAGLQVIPHDGFIGVLHAMLSQSSALCPVAEYLVKGNMRSQALYREGLYPREGMLKLPNRPGLGLDLNTDIVTSKRILEF